MSNTVYHIKDFAFTYPGSASTTYFLGDTKIYQGDKILLSGDSGCGKSTLLLALKGLIPHNINGYIAGDIFYNQTSIISNAPHMQEIGYLHQNPDYQFVCNDVVSELAFGLENQGVKPDDIKDRVYKFAATYQIRHLLNKNVTHLSGGQKQLVNLVAILLTEPSVLLLDEPTAFLDPNTAILIIAIIKQYAYDKTLVIIEHNLHYLSNLVNRHIRLNNNYMIESDVKFSKPSTTHLKTKANTYQMLLTIKNLTFSYELSNVISRFNLVLNKADIVAIIGKNGSGKSTLLKLIAKVLKVNDAIFFNDGKHVSDIASIRKHKYWKLVTLLWQNPENHFLHNFVLEEVQGDLDLLKRLNLLEYANCNPFSLSEGQKRRLSFAIAMKHDPLLYLLDEPTFGQDYANKLIIIDIIKNLALNGKSIILVSHDMDFIHHVTNRIIDINTI